ncbi:uncharacterized protein NPIL_5481, partial [Nephila pilipes]
MPRAHHHPDHSDHSGCDPINCPEDCTVDEKASPCPSCICTEKNITRVRRSPQRLQCSPPRCNPPCYLDYSTACPSCQCIGRNTGNVPRVQCSPPNCRRGCSLDYSTPCPSCSCGFRGRKRRSPPRGQCSPVKCDAPCYTDYSTPCPTCKCIGKDNDVPPQIQCT